MGVYDESKNNNGVLEADARKNRPTKAPRIKPSKSPKNKEGKNKESSSKRNKTPKPTKPVSVPMGGCGQHLTADHCVKECVWNSGYPSNGMAEYFKDGLFVEEDVDYYWYMMVTFLSLVFAFAVCVYRQCTCSVKVKTVGPMVEATPLLID